jgi:dTDP-4-dehydrorhamnose reductase
MVKILIAGADGFLGSNLVWSARKEHEVIATTKSFPFNMEECKVDVLDITDRHRCLEIVHKYEPDVIIKKRWFSIRLEEDKR